MNKFQHCHKLIKQQVLRQLGRMLQHCGMFLVGFSDSISLRWVKNILFVTHPQNKQIHPSSLKLLQTFKNTFIQVFIFLVLIPLSFQYFGYDLIYITLSILFLLLTYGYLFFYNSEVLTYTKEVALWATNFKRFFIPEFDKKEKTELFYSLSNQVKSFIFLLLYYTPIFLFFLIFTKYFPIIGTICLVISESFFNSTFYFLKKWPYDRYNIAFMERNLPYMLGYGLVVSIVCNVVLKGIFSSAAYFILSQWMIINCVIFSPPEVEFKSWDHVMEVIRKPQIRGKLRNSYNIHREQVRNEKEYRKQLIEKMRLLKPSLKITEFLNVKLSKMIDPKV